MLQGVDACTVTPAMSTDAITVAAVHSSKAFCTASGASACYFNSNYGSCVDISAPGYFINSCDADGVSSYTYKSGKINLQRSIS